MDAEDCSTECDPLDTITEGKQIIANNDVDSVNCQSHVLGAENPSIWLQTAFDSVKPQSGSVAEDIRLVSKTIDHIVSPIVSGGSPDLKALLPLQKLGKYRVIAKDKTFQFAKYLFPNTVLASDIPTSANPDFFIGANQRALLCEGDASLPIQLLKIPFEGSELLLAVDDTIETDFETSFNFDPRINDSGTGIEVTNVTNPPNGTATIELDGTVTYLPDNDYSGPDSFDYTITDDAMNTSTATVTVTVFQVIDAVNDEIEVEEDTPFNFDPRDNDIGAGIDIVSVTQPDNGLVEIELDGTLTYTPDPGYDGVDSFTYTIQDADGQEDTATVDVTVSPAAGDDLAEACADTCSMLDENRVATAIPAVELWLDCFCQVVSGGTIINTFEDGGTRNNDVTSTGSNRPIFTSSGGNGVAFDETDDQFLKKTSFAMFNSGSSTGGTMIVVASVVGGFAGTRIPIACWGPAGSPLMSIEFNFSGSWSVTGKINGQTRTGSFDPVGKTFVVAVGNQVDFGGGAASYIRIYEITGGAVSGGVLTHSPGSAVFTAGQSGDLYIGGHDATDTGSFKLHELVILSKPIIFGGAFDPDATCLADKWS